MTDDIARLKAECAAYRLVLIFYSNQGGSRASDVLKSATAGDDLIHKMVAMDAERQRLRARVAQLEGNL